MDDELGVGNKLNKEVAAVCETQTVKGTCIENASSGNEMFSRNGLTYIQR
jgi:hypothetical protein